MQSYDGFLHRYNHRYAGNFMSELKVAHMTGATPKKMEQWQIVGTILCAVLSVGVMILLNDAYGFVGDHALNAPQANAMAAIIEPLMTGGSAQWPLYMAGALFAIILWMIKVPPLALLWVHTCQWKSTHHYLSVV